MISIYIIDDNLLHIELDLEKKKKKFLEKETMLRNKAYVPPELNWLSTRGRTSKTV